MQHPIAPLLSEKYSEIDIGSSSFAQHDQITKERAQRQNGLPVHLAEKVFAARVFLEMKRINGQPPGFGCGFFVKHDQIVTNFHVVEGVSRGIARLVGESTTYAVEGITASDVENDLAILKVSDLSVQPLPIGDSDDVQLGDTVYVSGNPKDLEVTLSHGTASGPREVGNQKLLQMTVPISPGGNGGAVINEKGEVIGVSFVTLEDGESLNFAIPSNYLKTLLTRLEPAKPFPQRKQLVSATTYFYIGNEKYLMKLYQEAVVAYDKAIQLQSDFAHAYVNRGLTKEKLGQHESAIMDYSSAIKIDPTLAGTYNNRGSARRRLEQHFLALEDLNTAIQLDPGYVKAYINRGNAKNSLGHPNEALEDFDTALDLDPGSAEAYNNRGIAKATLMQLPDAVKDFDTAIEFNPELANAYYSRGIAKYIIGRQIRDAKSDLLTALKLAKRYSDVNLKSNAELALSLLAENTYRVQEKAKNNSIRLFITYSHKDIKAKDQLITYLAAMKREGLIKIWQDNEILPGDTWRDSIFKNLDETDILLYLVSADSLASKNCNKELVEALNTNVRVIPIILEHCDWLNHQLSGFQVLPDEGKPINVWKDENEGWQSTVASIRKVIHQMQTQVVSSSDISQEAVLAELEYERGYFLMLLGKIESAIKAYSDAIELNPHYSAAYNNRGVVYVDIGEYNLAIRDFNMVIELNPNDFFAYNNRGNTYEYIGNINKAIEDFNTAIKLDSNYVSPYINRGRIYGRKSMIPEAIDDFSKVITLKPDYAEAYYDRGIAYGKKRDFDLAIADYTQAIELNSNYVNAYCNRGSAYFCKGEFDFAIADYTKAIEMDPDSSAVYCNRGLVWLVLQNWDNAMADMASAKRIGLDVSTWFHKLYKSVADFERIIDAKLPEDIAAMLTPQ